MKGKLVRILTMVFIAVLVVSCSSTAIHSYGLTTNLGHREYEELGKVVITGQYTYAELLVMAQELYPECDQLIDIIEDNKVKSYFIISLYERTTTATAIKWLDGFSATEVRTYLPSKSINERVNRGILQNQLIQ